MTNLLKSPRRWVRSLQAGAIALLVLPTAGFAAEAPAGQAAAASAPAPAAAARAASKQGSLTLEGTAEPITVLLFDWASAPLALGFSTYVPQDMIARAPGGGSAPSVRFVANFGGVLQERAYLEMAFLPAGLTQAQAVSALGRSAPGGVPLKRCAPSNHRYAWAIAGCDIDYRSKSGSRIGGAAVLGRHGDRYFRLTMHYPLEYGGGFGPRAELILDEWRWRDTGAGL